MWYYISSLFSVCCYSHFASLELPQCLPDELLTLIICRKAAEELLHILSFTLILKLILLLYLKPYCVCVVVGCTRSELTLRRWSCKCSESSLSLPRKQEKADQGIAGSTWFSPGS